MAVRGRLKQQVEFWVNDELHATQCIVDMTRDGYTLPFLIEPPSHRRCNKCSAYDNPDFVHNAVTDLLCRGGVPIIGHAAGSKMLSL